jgi:SAM-dependent methyltransferase
VEETPPKSETPPGPVVYAGRFADRVADLPGGYPVLSEWEVLPARLASVTKSSTVLVVLDLFSFPFDALNAVGRDVPLVVVPPAGFDAEFLVAVFGAPVFRRLGFFDRVATADDDLWESLRRRYGWARGQRVVLAGKDLESAAGEITALLLAEDAMIPATEAPYGDKAAHRAERRVLEPRFAEARGGRAEDVAFDVLEVSSGTGRWAASFDLARTRYHGLDADGPAVETARFNFPEASFGLMGPGPDLPYEDEAFDLVFSTGALGRYPVPEKGPLLSEMWRVAKPGGRLLFLEDFVSGRPGLYPAPVTQFVDLLMEATNWQIVLEYVESLRYPGEDLTRAAVISASRLGVPKRW